MKASTFNAEDEAITEIFDFNGYRIAVFSQKNFNKSTNNEDVCFFSSHENDFIFGVCDGVGGYPMGKEAATMAANTITEQLEAQSSPIGFLSAMETASLKIRDFKVGARTTMAFAYVVEDRVKFYNIGDTEIIHTNNRASVIYYSIAQSPVGYAVEAGLLDHEASMDDPDRNIVSHLLGDEVLRIESSSFIALKKGHTVFIGSDGVYDNISKEEVAALISTGSIEKAVEELSQKFKQMKTEESWKKNDDISFCILRKIKS